MGSVRAQFNLAHDQIDLSALFIDVERNTFFATSSLNTRGARRNQSKAENGNKSPERSVGFF